MQNYCKRKINWFYSVIHIPYLSSASYQHNYIILACRIHIYVYVLIIYKLILSLSSKKSFTKKELSWMYKIIILKTERENSLSFPQLLCFSFTHHTTLQFSSWNRLAGLYNHMYMHYTMKGHILHRQIWLNCWSQNVTCKIRFYNFCVNTLFLTATTTINFIYFQGVAMIIFFCLSLNWFGVYIVYITLHCFCFSWYQWCRLVILTYRINKQYKQQKKVVSKWNRI